ncbi:syntaxin-binding protein 5-like isoform X1 [Dermacentor silvarum]|uniref:syntaxin-binding protein 5-like isoform X1 n=1 Tax=Dermacentor silvarum TaxID=543639 RepID=UPI001897B625|nr:syntaxin-binding protein 5-like isoform X1 [Dermacentor silvarum]
MPRSDTKKSGFFKGVLDGLRSSVTQPVKPEADVEETLRPEHFKVSRTVRHGFPFQPTALAFDPVQRILAIGTKNGSLRLFGRPGVDCTIQHVLEYAVIQILFLVNEGALISVCADDTLHLWNLRQKKPEVVHTLKFQKERITHCHLPFRSKWLYIGTERGNLHVVNIESFTLSGYVINWNKAIELSRKTHPGAVVHVSDNPVDSNKLLIGFETGALVLWDLRNRSADARFQHSEQALHSVAWHHEGKQFMCSHSDGSLTTWNIRVPAKPMNIIFPHVRNSKEGKPDPCKPIYKVEWKTMRGADSFVIFSGGLPFDKSGQTPALTVIHGKTTTVLEMEHNIVDFVTLCETPFQSDFHEPYAVVVLLQNDLVVVDLTSQGYPCFQNPYSMDLHESPVTFCTYLADCPTDLIPAFYSVGSKANKRGGFSEKEWPISGGEWGTSTVSYPEVIITGHADGSLKVWDASSVTLQVLYRLKTSKVFEKPKSRGSQEVQDEDPFAVEKVAFCADSRLLAVAGSSFYVIVFVFRKQEASVEVDVLETPILYEVDDDGDCSPECEYQRQSSQQGSCPSALEEGCRKAASEHYTSLNVKSGPQKWGTGFQPSLVCMLPWVRGETPGHITSLSVNSTYNLLAYGNECGLVIVDLCTKTCVLNLGTPDLYGSSDPYQRIARSPKRNAILPSCDNNSGEQEQCRSPTADQINGLCNSGTVAAQPTHSKRQADSRRNKSRKLQKLPNLVSTEEPPCFNTLPGNPQTPRNERQGLKSPSVAYQRDDKLDSSFSRSRSSSMSSLENISSEAILCLSFAEAFCRKSDTSTCPSLWVGTHLGSVLAVSLSVPTESRHTQPVIASPSGSIFRLKGPILSISFLDSSGVLMLPLSEQWKDRPDSRERDERRLRSMPSKGARISPTTSQSLEPRDTQFVVMASEKQARIVALPSQTCLYKATLTETSFVVCAEVLSIKSIDTACLVCYIANGNIVVYSLPSLKPLYETDFLPLVDMRIARTFCFSKNGHGMFLRSPSELQKFTISSDFCANLQEMLGTIFLNKDMPEAPKQSFFKGLFGGGPSVLDREELFGEASGKPSKTVARHIPGSTGNMEAMKAQAGTLAGEVMKARQGLVERGEALSQLEERTARMMTEAESYANTTHQLMNKYKDKKWYQF